MHLNRLNKAFLDPMTEVYLLFYQAILQLFVTINKFLQREDPLIHLISKQMSSFLKKFFGKFVSISVIKAASDITHINYSRDNQLPGTPCMQA